MRTFDKWWAEHKPNDSEWAARVCPAAKQAHEAGAALAEEMMRLARDERDHIAVSAHHANRDLDTARAEITRLSGEVAALRAVDADGGFSAWEVACSRADGLFLEVERLRGALERIATSGCEGDDEHAECGDVCIGHEPCDCFPHRAARALRGEPLATDWGRASCAHLCVDCAGFNKCGRCDGGVDASTKCKGCGCVLFGAFLATIPVPPGAPGLSTAGRVASIGKGLYGGNEDPNRCVCAEKETGRNAGTPHRHYEEPPYSCARCNCSAYVPAVPPSGAGEPQPGEMCPNCKHPIDCHGGADGCSFSRNVPMGLDRYFCGCVRA